MIPLPTLPLQDTGRTATVTVTRRARTAVDGVQVLGTPTAVATLADASVEDETGRYLRERPGARVDLVLGIVTNDVTSVIKPGDLASVTHQGETKALEVETVDTYRCTQQITLVSRVKA